MPDTFALRFLLAAFAGWVNRQQASYVTFERQCDARAGVRDSFHLRRYGRGDLGFSDSTRSLCPATTFSSWA